MTFKIICTIENGKSKLSIIPSQWETKNILRWPRKCTDKMVQDEKSSPKPDWISMPCIVKRRNYLSYDSAEQELARMLNNTDTEQEDENYYTRQAQSKQNERNVDYNFMVQQLESEQENRLPLTTNDPIYFSDNTWKDMRNESVHINTTNILETKINDTEQIANIQTNTDLEGTILHNHKVLNDNQILMIDNQKKVMKKVAEISVKLDELLTKLNKNQHTTVTTLSASKFNENNEDLYMKEIENKEQLDNFEKSLEDNSYKTKAMKTYSIVCSKGKGINCAYKLLDVIFSRDFLCKCSWAGGSRSDDTKIPLKSYKNTLRFFFDMIHMWDPEFTIEANEGFFKSILKNAKKRKDVKFVRMPTQRKRESGKKCKKECIGVAGFDVTKAIDTIKSQETVTNNTKKQTDNNMIKDMKDRDNNEKKSTQPTKQYKKSRFTVKHVANTITSLSQETVTKNTENQTENKNTKKMEIDKDNKREVLGQSSNQSSKEEQKARNMKEEKFGQSSKQFKKKEYITKESKEEKSSPSSKQSMKRRIPVQDVTNSIIAIHSQEVVPKNTENKKKEDKEKYYTEKERVQASKQPKKRRIAAKGMADIISISSQLQETEYQAENKKKDTDEDELDDEKKVEESDIEEKNKEDTDEDVLDDEEKIEESDLEETNNVDTDEEETYVAEERKEEIDEEEKIEESDEVDEADFN